MNENDLYDYVVFAVDNGADVNESNYNSDTYKNYNIYKYIFGSNYNVLYYAINKYDIELIKKVIKKGIKKEYLNKLLLFGLERWSTYYTNLPLEFINLAIDGGCDINQRDSAKWNALYYAVETDNKELFYKVIEKGIDVDNQTNFGTTALMNASNCGNIEFVKKLIDVGADVNLKDGSGNTALIHAVTGRRVEIVKLLLKAGAKVNDKNSNGWTALMCANSVRNNEEVVKLLIDAGAE